MSRYAESSDDAIRQHSGWLIPLAVFGLTSILSGLILVVYLAPPPRALFNEQVRFTPQTDIVKLKVHGHHFNIPANYLKYGSDREGGERKQIKLIAVLPDMAGYATWEDSAFRSNAPDAPAVELLIHDDPLKLTEVAWLNRIYMPYIADRRGVKGSFGLTRFDFRKDSGYRDEELFVGESNHRLIVLQCLRASAQVPSPSCHTDLPIAHGVALSLRFKRAHLSQWQEIAESADRLIKSFNMQPPG